MRKHCPRCSNPVSLTTIDSVSAEAAPLKVTISAMPAMKCAGNHAAPVDGNFMVWLMRELRERAGALDAGEEKGMLFKKYFCACGAELEAKPGRRQAFPLPLAYEGVPAFAAALEMPVYKCAGCGKEQLRSRNAIPSHIGAAVVGINDAAGFPHSA